mgnify:CR=1 FL=1
MSSREKSRSPSEAEGEEGTGGERGLLLMRSGEASPSASRTAEEQAESLKGALALHIEVSYDYAHIRACAWGQRSHCAHAQLSRQGDGRLSASHRHYP